MIQLEVAAAGLRNSINKLFENNGDDVQFICMGIIIQSLILMRCLIYCMRQRDYHLIKKKRKLLFNPFWYLLSDKKTNNLGTYYYNSASINRWYVFDQMIFLHHFIWKRRLF